MTSSPSAAATSVTAFLTPILGRSIPEINCARVRLHSPRRRRARSGNLAAQFGDLLRLGQGQLPQRFDFGGRLIEAPDCCLDLKPLLVQVLGCLLVLHSGDSTDTCGDQRRAARDRPADWPSQCEERGACRHPSAARHERATTEPSKGRARRRGAGQARNGRAGGRNPKGRRDSHRHSRPHGRDRHAERSERRTCRRALGVPLRLCLGLLDLTLLALEGADLRSSPLKRDLELAGHVREGVDVIGDRPDLLRRPYAEAVQPRDSSLEPASRRGIPLDRFVEALNGTLPQLRVEHHALHPPNICLSTQSYRRGPTSSR